MQTQNLLTHILKGEADAEAKPSDAAANRADDFIRTPLNDPPGIIVFSNRVIVLNITRAYIHSRGAHEVKGIHIDS